MKKDLPNIAFGILIGLFIAWLIGWFSPSQPPTSESAAKTADTSTPAQAAAPAPATKPNPATLVAAPAVPPAKVSQSASAAVAMQAAGDQAAFAQVRQQSRVKAITNNLRQLSTAAQQYMLDKGVTAAGYFDLVGTGTDNYLRSVSPVMGEDYSSFYITQHDTQAMVVAPDGTTVTYNM